MQFGKDDIILKDVSLRLLLSFRVCYRLLIHLMCAPHSGGIEKQNMAPTFRGVQL